MVKSFLEKLPAPLRTYKTEKFIRVDVPRVGIFHRTWQLIALFGVFAQLYMNDGWAMSEVPGGMCNAWDEAGSMLTSTSNVTAKRLASPYCSNPEHSYTTETYTYGSPKCEALLPAELTQKTTASVFYTTAFIETITTGWPCDDADAPTKRAQCTARGGVHSQKIEPRQCLCAEQRPVYPLAVEEMALVFEHSFDTTLVGLSGSSAEATGGDDLYSNVFFANGTARHFASGRVLRLPVADWLAAANVSLDEINGAVRADSSGAYPRMRTSGVNIKVQIEYSNIDKATGRAILGQTQVHADVTLQAENGTWTGAGVQTIWVQFPTGDRDLAQNFTVVERWRQGVLFQFHTTGMIFKFDCAHRTAPHRTAPHRTAPHHATRRARRGHGPAVCRPHVIPPPRREPPSAGAQQHTQRREAAARC
jgi:hypothetical protein